MYQMKKERKAGNRSYGVFLLSGLLLAGCAAGCGADVSGTQRTASGTAQEGLFGTAYAGYRKDPAGAAEFAGCTNSLFESAAASGETAYAVDDACSEQGAQAPFPAGGENVAYAAETAEGISDREALGKQLSCYESFGMTYDVKTNVLKYKGKRVRDIEDYYPLDEKGEERAGVDFFDEKGVVDVCAIRDFDGIVRNADGSFDPSGRLAGLRQCTDEEFAARDIEALKNPETTGAICGEPLSREEKETIAAEYQPFGVTYDGKKDVWYYKGEKIRRFLDVLMSNGADMGGGSFRGILRQYWQDDGTVDICTERDYDVRNAEGYGTLTGIRASR